MKNFTPLLPTSAKTLVATLAASHAHRQPHRAGSGSGRFWSQQSSCALSRGCTGDGLLQSAKPIGRGAGEEGASPMADVVYLDPV